MNLNQLADKYHRARLRQGLQHPEARRQAAKATSRDTHPVTGSDSILQEAGAGIAPKQVVSLNTSDGGKAFCFDVPNFGWDQGELEIP